MGGHDEIDARAVVWFDHASSDKRRPGVVMRLVANGRAFVLYGTGTERPGDKAVVIEPGSQAGRILKLSKPTYFYARNIEIRKLSDLEGIALCPADVFLDLRELIGDAAAEHHKRS